MQNTEHFKKFTHVVFEIYKQEDLQTHRQTLWLQYTASRDEIIKPIT